MRIISISISTLAVLTSSFFAIQGNASTIDPVSKEKMEALSFLVGDWEGAGWIQDREGRHEFTSHEAIRFELNGTILMIRGKHMESGVVTHDAMGILSYQPEEGQYQFASYLSDGRSGTYKAEVKDRVLIWYQERSQGTVRFTIQITSDGQWVETGEFSRDLNEWHKFFEMVLHPVQRSNPK